MNRSRLLTWAGISAGLLLGAVALRSRAMLTEKTPGLLEGLTPATRAAALRWAELAAAEGLTLTLTSGRRSAVQQAKAMLAKVARGEDLYRLYRSAGDTLDRLFAAPRDIDAWAWVLDDEPISAHQEGEAVDARRWGMTEAQLYRLGELAIAAGFRRALLESDHLHAQM